MNGDSSKEVTRCFTIQSVMWDSELLRERSNLQDALILLNLEGKKLRRAEHEGFLGSVDRFSHSRCRNLRILLLHQCGALWVRSILIGAIEANLPGCSGYIDGSIEGIQSIELLHVSLHLLRS